MRCPDAHSRSDLTWGGRERLARSRSRRETLLLLAVVRTPRLRLRETRTPKTLIERREERERDRARTALGLRPAHVLGTSAVGRAEWQCGRTARCTPGPPGVEVHDLHGQVDFGALFEESWRQTTAFSTGASAQRGGLASGQTQSPDQADPSPLQRDAYRTIIYCLIWKAL